MSEVNFQLLGKDTDGVRDWQGLQILATFDNANAQANITTGEIRFVGKAGRALIDYIDKGANGSGPGVTEAPDFNVWISLPVYAAFKGIIDFAQGYTIDRDKHEVVCKIRQLDGLNTFENISQAVTFALLESKNVFTTADYSEIPYIKEIEFEFLAAAMLAISIYTMTEKAIALVKDIGKNLAIVIGITAAGVGGLASGPIAALVIAILELAYAVALIILLIKLADQLFDYLLVPVRYHKGINYFTLLKKAVEFLGYNFNCSIPEMPSIFYLPKKTKQGGLTVGSGTGLPTSGEPIYTLDRAIGLAKQMFGAKVKIIGKDFYLEALNNGVFWNKNSTYVLKPVLNNLEKYNNTELKATRLIRFTEDDRDAFTLSNFTGTVYEVKTQAKNPPLDPRKSLLSGIEDVLFPVALGTRKDALNVTETVLYEFALVVDNTIGLFGGSSTYSSKIKNRIGMLKMSSDLVAVPKLMRMIASNLHFPINYRDLWSAKYLYNHYLEHFSFVLNNFQNQYRIFEKIKMDANLADFLKVILSNRCKTHDNRQAEILSILWYVDKNYWEADYRVKQIFAKNLIETYTEPT